jgi:CBS-domain-containing membrane protein
MHNDNDSRMQEAGQLPSVLKKILVKEVMVTKPITIGVEEPFSKVWDMFKFHKIRHLPVIDDERKLQGIVTQRDLYRMISPRRTMEDNLVYDKAELDRFILKHVMTKEVMTLKPDDTLGRLIDMMVRKKFGCIPIVDDKNYLVGIVTQIDILRAIAKYFI